MSVEQLAAWSQVVASVAVFVSLIFVAWELRMSTKVATATARHNLSHFAKEISEFNAVHADRLAKVSVAETGAKDLTPGDLQFRFWSQVQFLLHAETFFQHQKLGLIPQSHWEGYCRFFAGYVSMPGLSDTWRQMRPSFATDFAAWVDSHVAAIASPLAPVPAS